MFLSFPVIFVDAKGLLDVQSGRDAASCGLGMSPDPEGQPTGIGTVVIEMPADGIQRREAHDSPYKRGGRGTDGGRTADLADNGLKTRTQQAASEFGTFIQQ